MQCGKDDYRPLFPEYEAFGTDLWHYILLGTISLLFVGEWFASYWRGISYRKDKGPAKIMRLTTQRSAADIITTKVALPVVN